VIREASRPVPIERALDIIRMEAEQHHLDPELVRLFVEARVYSRVIPGEAGDQI